MNLEKGEIVLIPNADGEAPQVDSFLNQMGIKTLLAVPVIYQGQLGGVLYLDSQAATPAFTKKDFRIVIGLADLADMAIQKDSLFKEMKRINLNLLNIIFALEDANRELKSLDQMKTNLLSNVSH